jgi:hypothetical protein
MRKIEKEEVSVTYEVKKTTAVLLFPNCTYMPNLLHLSKGTSCL